MKLFFKITSLVILLIQILCICPYAYDEGITVRLMYTEENEVEEISMKEYLAGVMVGEMDIDSPTEALKAVCIAARTYTLYMCDKSKNKAYDVVANASVSQAFISTDSAQELWGNRGKEKYKRMKEIVELTDGEVIEYKNEPICALYHASSFPFTENCENVFLESLPYLKGRENVETVENTISKKLDYTLSEFNKILSENGYPEIDSGTEINVKLNNNERCSYIIFKSQELAFSIGGSYLRKIFGLPSTSFNIYFQNNTVTFETWGFGHGVGLSQTGAEILGNEGKSYQEILKFYYDGTEVVKY